MRVRLAGPVSEQGNRRRPVGLPTLSRLRQAQRRQPVPGLSGHPRRLATGRQYPHIIGGGQQRSAQSRHRVDQMLTVVEHQQHLPGRQHVGQGLRHRPAAAVLHSERRCDRGRHQARIRHPGQLGQPHPIGEPAGHPLGHLAGQPGLSHPARPGHRHHPVPGQEFRDLIQLNGTADEAGQHGREAVHARGHANRWRRGAQALQRRELLRQAGGGQLVDPLRRLNVLQPVKAQVTE